MKNTSLPLKAFKRAPSLELSKWYMGMLLTNLTETQDTNEHSPSLRQLWYLELSRLRICIRVRTSSSTFSKESSTCM